jgi:hypothetical protein
MLPHLSAQSPDDVPLHCPVPSCEAERTGIAVRSTSIVTFRYPACGFMWSAEIAALPEPTRTAIRFGLAS